MPSFVTSIALLPDDPLGWSGRLLVPQKIVDQIPHREDGSQRVICSIEGMDSWHAALMSDGQGGRYIIFSKDKRKQLAKAQLDTANLHVSLEADVSKYGMPLPIELEEMFKLDPQGAAYFHQLLPGKQRNLLYLIGKPKAEAARLHLAITMLDYLKAVRGRFDFRELGAYLKAHPRNASF